MKRTEFLKYLKEKDCSLKREGHDHSWWEIILNGKHAHVARHTELSNIMCKKICKQLGIPPNT